MRERFIVRLIAYRGYGKISVFRYVTSNTQALKELYEEYPANVYTRQRYVIIK